MKACTLVFLALLTSQALADPAKHEKRRPDLRLVVSGAVVFGFFYLLPLGLALRFEEPELAVPVFGPLIDLRRCRECTDNAVEQGIVAGLVLDALLQAAGASLFIVGMLRRKPMRVVVAPSLSPVVPGVILRGAF